MKPARYFPWMGIWVICLTLLPSLSHASGLLPEASDPVSDSVMERHRDSILFRLNLDYLNGVNEHKTPFELIPIIEEILTLDPAQYNQWFNLGMEYIKIKEYYAAIDALNKGLDLYPSKKIYTLSQIYISLSFCYHKTERHQKEREILDMLYEDDRWDPGIVGRYLICAHYRMRFVEEEDYKNELVQLLRDRGLNESDVAYYMGRLYLNEDYL
jgi:tetratricopeptide (TPR) repeat protein